MEQRKLCSTTTKSGTMWEELVAACHMDETGQIWYQFILGTKPQPHGDEIVFFGDDVNAGQ